MSATGAVYLHPAAKPAGSSSGSQGATGPAPMAKAGGPEPVSSGEATRPAICETPAAGAGTLRGVGAAPAPRRPPPKRCGPHGAPGPAAVVRCGGSAGYTWTGSPVPSSATAVLRPMTPAPIT